MPTVYEFTKYSPTLGETVRGKRPATLEAIHRANGTPDMATAREVSADDLDGDDFVAKTKLRGKKKV
jgi:hypothetical protein